MEQIYQELYKFTHYFENVLECKKREKEKKRKRKHEYQEKLISRQFKIIKIISFPLEIEKKKKNERVGNILCMLIDACKFRI